MPGSGVPELDVVLQHLHLGSSALFSLAEGRVTFDVDPADPSLGVRVVDEGGRLPDVAGYDHLGAQRVWTGGQTWLQLRISGVTVVEDGYRLACAVLERVLVGGEPLAEAVQTSLQRLQELLARQRGLPLQREIGLWGELHALQRLATVIGAQQAVQAWQGPGYGEHDFTLTDADVEVKTTASEGRVHHIATLTQLQPVEQRPLWLLSLRITRSNGTDARTLHEQIEHTASVLAPHDEDFRRCLKKLREQPIVADPWSTRWRLRDTPALFAVGEDFPGLTNRRLHAAGFDVARLDGVEQRINLEGWPTAAPVPAFWPHNDTPPAKD